MTVGSRGLSRRTFVKYGIAAAAEAVALRLDGSPALAGPAGPWSLASNQISQATTSHPAAGSRIRPTRVDTHGHAVPGLAPERVISLMDRAGISHMVLMARGRNDWLTAEIYRQAPQRILPFVSSMYRPWHRHDERVLPYTENQLATGVFRGVGEVMLRYFGNRSKDEPVIDAPADSRFMKRLADIVAHHDAVMIVHMEPEPEAIASLENLLRYNRRLKLVWAHCGTVARVGLNTIGHTNIGVLMDRHPNLHTDIAGVQPESVAPSGGARRPPITDDDGVLLPAFRAVLERHSDSVLFGLDTPWAECWADEPFRRWVGWADKVVAQLNDPGKAAQIMHGNAARLFRL